MDFHQLAKKYEQELVSDLQEIVRIPSLYDEASKTADAPFGKELRKALDWFLAKGKTAGFDIQDYSGYAGYLSWGEGAKSMGMLGHLDIVPIGVGWSKEPFGAQIIDGVMYGRGTGDDKGPTVCALTAMKLLKDAGFIPKKKIYLIAGCDEESGMACMKHYKEVGPIPDFGFVPDASFPVIYGEKGIMNVKVHGHPHSVIVRLEAGERPNIVIGEAEVTVAGNPMEDYFAFYLATQDIKGSYRSTSEGTVYHFDGVFSHGSLPQEGINAAWHALNFVGGAYNDATAHKIAALLADYRGKQLGIKKKGAHMGDLTMNLGIVKAYADDLSIVLDIRYPQECKGEEVFANIKQAFVKTGLDLTTDLLVDKEPLFVDPKSELVSTLERIYRKHSGDVTTPLLTMGGGTYARTLPNFVAFGAEFPNRPWIEGVGDAHQKDEGVEIEALVLATAIYAEAIYELTK
jgi:succinyl-diaminopimelate desuccinylase